MRYAHARVKIDGGEPAVLQVDGVDGVPATEVGYTDLACWVNSKVCHRTCWLTT